MPMNNTLDAGVLDQLFHKARTYNGYTDRLITNEQLTAIWDLMKMGPTSANCLPARIVWCASTEAKEKLAALTMESNAEKIRKAPVTAIIGMDMEFYELLPELFPHADAKSWFAGNEKMIETTAFRNSTLQGAYLMIAARTLGIDSGAMSGFNNDAVDAEFFAGTSVKSNFLCTLGYGDASTIFERSPRPAFERFNTIL